MAKPVYYDCGICGRIHPWGFTGDCRDDSNRFNEDDLVAKHGWTGYEVKSFQDRLAADDRGEP